MRHRHRRHLRVAPPRQARGRCHPRITDVSTWLVVCRADRPYVADFPAGWGFVLYFPRKKRLAQYFPPVPLTLLAALPESYCPLPLSDVTIGDMYLHNRNNIKCLSASDFSSGMAFSSASSSSPSSCSRPIKSPRHAQTHTSCAWKKFSVPNGPNWVYASGGSRTVCFDFSRALDEHIASQDGMSMLQPNPRSSPGSKSSCPHQQFTDFLFQKPVVLVKNSTLINPWPLPRKALGRLFRRCCHHTRPIRGFCTLRRDRITPLILTARLLVCNRRL